MLYMSEHAVQDGENKSSSCALYLNWWKIVYIWMNETWVMDRLLYQKLSMDECLLRK